MVNRKKMSERKEKWPTAGSKQGYPIKMRYSAVDGSQIVKIIANMHNNS
jgi:hypothetical protein